MSELNEIKIVENSNIKINGRYVSDNEAIHFFWTGSSIEMNLKAKELYILVEGLFSFLEHYIAIEINGVITQRIMLDGSKQWIPVFKNFDNSIIINVRIIKEVQAMSEDPEHILNIYSLKTDGELLAVNNDKLKIEFIGDSITSGEGSIGTDIDGPWISHYFSHIRSYPYMLSKLLDADYRIFSKSGWGVYCSWDNNPHFVIPKHYENICSVMTNDNFARYGIFEKNDFSIWQPDAIIINLCTNDCSGFYNLPFIDSDGSVYKLNIIDNKFDIDDINKIKNAIYDFLIILRKNNKKSHIYWAYGMLNNELEPYIIEVINNFNIKNNDKVNYISLPKTKESDFGSKLHPGIMSHKEVAYVIADVLKNDFAINKLNSLIL